MTASGPPDGGWGEGDGDCGGDALAGLPDSLALLLRILRGGLQPGSLAQLAGVLGTGQSAPQHGGVDEPAATEDIARAGGRIGVPLQPHARAGGQQAREPAARLGARARPRSGAFTPARSTVRSLPSSRTFTVSPSTTRTTVAAVAGATGTKRATALTAAMRRTECSRVLMRASLWGDAPRR